MLHVRRCENQLNKRTLWKSCPFYFNSHFQLQINRIYRSLGFAAQMEYGFLFMPKCSGAKLPYFGVNIRFHAIFLWVKVIHQLFSTVKGTKNKTDWNNNNSASFMGFFNKAWRCKKKKNYRENKDLGLFCSVLTSSFHLQKE